MVTSKLKITNVSLIIFLLDGTDLEEYSCVKKGNAII